MKLQTSLHPRAVLRISRLGGSDPLRFLYRNRSIAAYICNEVLAYELRYTQNLHILEGFVKNSQLSAVNCRSLLSSLFTFLFSPTTTKGKISSLRSLQMDADPRQYENIVLNEKDIHKVVLSYLVHNCFKDTVDSFIASTGMKQPTGHLEDMEKRKRIFHFALDGSASKAIELTEEFAPGLLEENKDLHFDLLSLHFVELVCSRNCAEALGFAQSKLTPFGKEQKYVEKLEDFMALLAYEEPEKSPMFHLLSMDYRQHVADSLNRTILAHTKLPSYSAMERLIQQTTVVKQCLDQESGKDGHQPFFLKDFLKS